MTYQILKLILSNPNFHTIKSTHKAACLHCSKSHKEIALKKVNFKEKSLFEFESFSLFIIIFFIISLEFIIILKSFIILINDKSNQKN
jgi:hypothetical protein